MSTVQIGSETQDLSNFDENWVNQQINRRRQDGQNVCVRVSIATSGVNLSLTTPGCGGAGGGGREPNRSEREIVELWNSKKLNSTDFAGGNLIAFLKQIRRSLT